MSMHFLKVEKRLSFLLIPGLRKTPHAWKNIITHTEWSHSASSVRDAAAKGSCEPTPHILMCAHVSLLTVLTHLSLNVQSSDTESNSLSYLINPVFKLFHLPLISSANDGLGSLGTLQNSEVCFGTWFAACVSGPPACRLSLFWCSGWGFSMLFIRTVAVPCPADLHCFTGTDCDGLNGHLYLIRNREPLIAYEPSGFQSVLFHVLRGPRTRECYSVLSCR